MSTNTTTDEEVQKSVLAKTKGHERLRLSVYVMLKVLADCRLLTTCSNPKIKIFHKQKFLLQ
jgi:hypothetical protein